MFIGVLEDLERVPVPEEHALKTTKQVVFSPQKNWESHVMRIFTMEEEGGTHEHEHSWPHWVLILEGFGILTFKGEEHPLERGTYIFLPQGERHSFTNTGDSPLVFMCIVPKEGEQ